MAMEMIRLNLIPDGKPPVVHCKQFDVGRRIRVCVFEGNTPYIFTNETVELDVRKNDTTLVSVDLEVESGKRYVDIITTEQMCTVIGKQEAEIRIYSDVYHTNEIGSLSFFIQVEQSVVNRGLTSASEITNLERQVHDQVVIELRDHGAEDTGYNNAYSGLDATNVQSAIDEINDKITDISDDYYTKSETDEKFATKDNIAEQVAEVAPAIVEEVAPAVVREVAPAVIEDVAPPIIERLAPSAVEEVAPSIVERLVPAEVAEVAPAVVREVAPPIVGELVPIAVGDNYYNKTQVDGKVNAVKERVDNVTVTQGIEKRIAISPFTLTAGYVGANGNVSSSTSYHYTNKIPVSEGDKIYVYGAHGNYVSQYRFVCCYHNGSAVTEKGGQNLNDPFVVPSGIEEVILSIADSMTPTRGEVATVETKEQLINQSDVDALVKISANAKENSLFYGFNYTAGNTFETSEQFEDFCSYKVSFFAKITSITGIAKIGKGIGYQYGGGIGFDGTNLYMYQNASSAPTQTQAHGLTLKDYVSITLDSDYTTQLKVTIATNGGSYTWTIATWFAHYGYLSFTANDNMSECKLAYTCTGLIKDTWLYGDSYFSNFDSKRWTYYLVSRGYRNYLINAYGGRRSNGALASFKLDLKMNRVPRRVIWCLGMNDKDGDNSANESWLSSVQEVMQICSNLNIELVLATIPNVPSTNAKNIYKNAYVVASGYRYIDFAKAVSLNGDSTWYDGMLSSDNIHPEAQGALALYSQAVATVPELLL